RPVLRHEHGPGLRLARRGRQLDTARGLPAGDLVGRGGSGRLMCELRLPPTLTPLFSGLPRRVEVEAATVAQAIDELDRQWPGVRDRLCEPGPALRRHIQVGVDKEPAALDPPAARGCAVLAGHAHA